MIREQAIIVDIDGTLSNNAHRQHHIANSEAKDWESFHNEAIHDQPNEWCVELIEDMYSSARHKIVILVTARYEKYRKLTEEWLDKFNIPYDFLYMRPNDVHGEDTDYKKKVYEDLIKPYYDVVFCIEDRPRITRMWRGLGLPCLSCNDVEF